MATVTSASIGTNHEKITVQISKEDYLPDFDKQLKSYAKNANIPGFRKGMTPVGIIKKMHGQAIFADEILRTAGREVEKYLEDNKVKFFARPLAVDNNSGYNFDISNPQDYSFDFEIGLQPNIEIPFMQKSNNMDFYKVNITDKMIDDEVEHIRYKFGKMEHPETVDSEDSVLNVKFYASDADGNIAEGDEGKKNSLLVKYFSDTKQKDLMGKKATDKIVINAQKDFAEKNAPAIKKDLGLDPSSEDTSDKFFLIEIESIGLMQKASIDAGLFNEVYKDAAIATEEEFRNKLKQDIQAYWDEQARARMHNEIFETLVHDTPIELPTNFLKRWLAEGGEQRKTSEEVEKEFGTFDHQLRWQIVSDKLISENNIVASKEEMEAGVKMDIQNYFAQSGMGGMDVESDWVKQLVEKQMSDKKYSYDMYNKIVTDKLFNFLETKVQKNEKSIELDDFVKLPQSHHHHH